jgi:hypothetical protein
MHGVVKELAIGRRTRGRDEDGSLPHAPPVAAEPQ